MFQFTNYDVNISPQVASNKHRTSFQLYLLFLFTSCVCLPLSGSQCHAAAAAACAACSFPCCPGKPPLELSVVCAAFWPHGQEAGGAGLNGTDAGNVQLHAGEDLLLGTYVYCRLNMVLITSLLSGLYVGVWWTAHWPCHCLSAAYETRSEHGFTTDGVSPR